MNPALFFNPSELDFSQRFPSEWCVLAAFPLNRSRGKRGRQLRGGQANMNASNTFGGSNRNVMVAQFSKLYSGQLK